MCCLYSLSSFQPNKLWRILNFFVHEDLLTLVLPLVDPQLKHFLWITETLDIHTAFQFQRQGKYLDSGLIKISYLVFKQIYTLSSWSPTGPFIGILYQFESNNDRVALLQLFCVVVQVVIMSLWEWEFPEQGRCKLFTSKVWGWVFLALARNIQIALSKEQKVISGCIRSIIVGLSRGQWRAIIAIVDGLTNHLHTLTLLKGHRTRWEWEGLGERSLWCFDKNMEKRWGFLCSMPLFLFLLNSCDRQTVFLNATKAIYGLKLELAMRLQIMQNMRLYKHLFRMRLYFPNPHVEYAE